DVVALEPLVGADLPVQTHRATREPNPQPGESNREQQPQRDRIERLRAERPRGGVGQQTEGEQRAAAPGHTGTGVCSSASRTSSPGDTPAEHASGASISRCASTGSATVFTSSGSTNSRPTASARAFATRSRAIPARGLAPTYTRSSWRVWRSSATTYRLRLSSTKIPRA